MIQQNLTIHHIPVILWGETSEKLIIAIHGSQSSKSDTPIAILAEEAVPMGYQVLSFDLPQHGERVNEPVLCKAQICVKELVELMKFAQARSGQISLFACSMGAYFSLMAYRNFSIEKSLFLSPVVDMERLINNMRKWFNISEEKLQREQEITTPMGETMYWDYYQYVKTHPVNQWHSPTSILYGENDELCEWGVITSFAERFNCNLEVVEQGEHYFHTPEQLKAYTDWLNKHLG